MAEEVKRCVVLGVVIQGCRGFKAVNFYGFDSLFSRVEEEDTDGKPDKYHNVHKIGDNSVIAKPLTTLHSFYDDPTYACRKNIIYRIGGEHAPYNCRTKTWIPPNSDLSNTVQCWNSLRPDKGWHYHSMMHQPRCEPHVLFLDSKMYLAGGMSSDSDYDSDDHIETFIFMEVMASRRSGWLALENPPVSFDECFVSAAWPEKGKLLFGSQSSAYFYAYTPDSCSWECCQNLPFPPLLDSIGPGVVVGGHCLWLDDPLGTRLFGLNLSNGKCFFLNLAMEGIVPSVNCCHYNPFLISLGEENEENKVAIIWTDKIVYSIRGEPGASDLETSNSEKEDHVSNEENSGSSSSSEESNSEEDKEEEAKGKNKFLRRCHEDDETKEKRAANKYGGYHLVEFSIDFARAQKKGSLRKIRKRGYKVTRCLTVTSRRKLIAPSHGHYLAAAFTMDVALPKCNGATSSGTEFGGTVLRKCKKKEKVRALLQVCENKKVDFPEKSNSSCKKRRK